MPLNFIHKKKFLFRNKELVPIQYFHEGECTGSNGPNSPLVQYSYWGTTPQLYLPYVVTQKSPNDIDILRTAYNKFWTRPVINSPARYGNFPARYYYDNRFAASPDQTDAFATPSTNLSDRDDDLGLAICFTDDRPYNTLAEFRNLNNSNLQSRVIPSSLLLSDNYTAFPWNSVEASPPSNPTFLSSKREKYTIQITPPLTPWNFTPAQLQEFIDFPNESVPEWWKDNTKWALFVKEKFHEKSYEDTSFSMWIPFEDKEINEGSPDIPSSVRDVYAKITPSYNFYIKSYEETIADSTIPESLLPNLYAFASEFDNRFLDGDNSRFSRLINLQNDRGENQITKTFVDIIGPNGRKIGETDKGQYFETWSDKIQNFPDPNTTFSKLKSQYENVALPISNTRMLEDHKGNEILFPMNIKIDFVTDVQTKFADLVESNGLFPLLIKNISEFINGMTGVGASRGLYSFDYWFNIATEMCEYVNKFAPSTQFYLGGFIDGVIDPTQLQDEYKDLFDDLEEFRITFLGRIREDLDLLSNPANALDVLLRMNLFAAELDKLVEPTSNQGHFRSFKEILQGKEAYSETLLYRIEKVDADVPDQTIQNFWFPNSSKIDVMSYIDTQVKYNKRYRYKIWAYQMVIGNKYEYKVNKIGGISNATVVYPSGKQGPFTPPPPPSRLGDFLARLCVFNEPLIKIIEVPYYDTKIDYPLGIAVVDTPPVRPDINIIPYQDTGDKILLWLNGSVGDYWEEPISVLPSDDFSEMLRLHGRDTNSNNTPDEVHFKSDDHVTEFDIFRLEHRPTKYTDFTQGAHTKIFAAQGSTSAGFVDDIKPNTKYYYCFRAIDNHNHTSNPTSVYECEIVQDNENIYSLIQLVDMDVDVGRQVSKPVRRFLQIKPSFSQALLNESELSAKVKSISSANNDFQLEGDNSATVTAQLGKGQQSIWGEPSNGRKFKIRLSSTKSSKKLDINVKFKTTQTTSNE